MADEVAKKGIEEVSTSIVGLLQSLFTATKTVALYPPESPTVVRMVENAQQTITTLIPIGGSLDMSFLEEKLIVNGQMLDDALQKRSIVKSIFDIFKNRKISSVTFWDGLTKEELRKFLIIFGTKAPTLGTEDQVGLEEVFEEEDITHVEVDEQIYVAISKREKVIDARVDVDREEDAALRALKDEVFARFIAGDVALGDLDKETMQAMTSDPEKMISMVESVVTAKGWDKDVETLPYRIDETRAVLSRISSLAEQVEDPLVRSKLHREVGKITSEIETPHLTEMLLTSAGVDAESVELPKVILPLLGDQKLASVVESVVREYQGLADRSTGDEWPTRRMIGLKSILDDAADSAEGELAAQLGEVVQRSGIDDVDVGKRAEMTGAELASKIAEGGDISLCEGAKGPTLVVAARHLFENNRNRLGSYVMEKIDQAFKRQSPEAKYSAATQIWELFKVMRDLGKEEYAGELIDEVKAVLDERKIAVDTFSSLTKSMGEVAASGEEGFAGLGDVSVMDSGSSVSGKAIEKLMSADTGKVVQAVFSSGDKAAQDAISRVLLGMEDRAVPALLETATNATDRETLQSVADSLNQMNTDPLPQIASRFSIELETQQLENLVELVSMVGGENSVSVLDTLMLSEIPEVRVAVVNALGSLGGRQALQMLLAESMNPDPLIRIAAVRNLGNFKDYMAVKRLMEIATPGKKGELLDEEMIIIAACRAIGMLNVHQAVPILTEIARGGKRHLEYSEELRAAATYALGDIDSEDARKALHKMLKDQSMLVRSTARKALRG